MLAFPCNQFGGQEPGSNAEVKEFATSTYGVTFPMFAKIDVNGENESPLYTFLKGEQPGEGATPDIVWNFTKFLVAGDGRVVKRYEPTVTPEEIAADWEAALA